MSRFVHFFSRILQNPDSACSPTTGLVRTPSDQIQKNTLTPLALSLHCFNTQPIHIIILVLYRRDNNWSLSPPPLNYFTSRHRYGTCRLRRSDVSCPSESRIVQLVTTGHQSSCIYQPVVAVALSLLYGSLVW